jgi:hypothetical protein
MSDINEFLAPIVDVAGRTVWDMPADVRRRGTRRRAQRRAIAAGAAALLVVGVVAGASWAIGRPVAGPGLGHVPGDSQSTTTTPLAPSASNAPTGSPTPSATASTKAAGTPGTPGTAGTAIPEAAMLRGPDVGSGYTAAEWTEGEDSGNIRMMMSYCGQGNYTSAREHEVAWRWRTVSDTDRTVFEEVSRYEATWAARHMADLRATLPRCETVDLMGDPKARVAWTVIATDFTGDGAVLLKEVRGSQVQYHAMAYRGDLEVRLRIMIGATEAQARTITQRASDRLCAASPSC